MPWLDIARAADSGSTAPGDSELVNTPMPTNGVEHRTPEDPKMSKLLRSRTAGALLTAAIVGLTLATGYIHLTLGGLLFTLNGLGFVGLAGLVVIGAVAPVALVQRFSWFPRIALIGYAAMTIAGYLVMGPYFTLGFIAKGIEVALIAVVVVDIVRVYGSPMAFVRSALDSVASVLPERFRPTAA